MTATPGGLPRWLFCAAEQLPKLDGPPSASHGFKMISKYWLKSILAALVAHLLCGSAWAWGSEGHQVIALIAEKQLTPQAKAEVARLLALEPGETLTSISTWADEHRSPQTGPWHYVNFPKGDCNFQAERDCPDGRCVVAAIEKATAVLGSNASDEKRLTALKYLVHFVGDVHQPLHAGFGEDRGGNTYQLQAFKRGTNLHAVWDSGLIRSLDMDANTLASQLADSKSSNNASAWNPALAAEESCQLVAINGFYPGRMVDAQYIQRYLPVMKDRLFTAGARLGYLLNRIWK